MNKEEKDYLRNRINQLKFDIEVQQYMIISLQNKFCTHDDVQKIPYKFEGYCEPTYYGYNCKCNICDKTWEEEQ